MSFDESEHATLRQIDNRYRAWSRIEETRQQGEWERSRWQTLWLLSPHLKKGKLPSIQRQMKFAWEKEEKVEFKGDANAILAKWNDEMKKK
jgi:hypothetical protein